MDSSQAADIEYRQIIKIQEKSTERYARILNQMNQSKQIINQRGKMYDDKYVRPENITYKALDLRTLENKSHISGSSILDPLTYQQRQNPHYSVLDSENSLKFQDNSFQLQNQTLNGNSHQQQKYLRNTTDQQQLFSLRTIRHSPLEYHLNRQKLENIEQIKQNDEEYTNHLSRSKRAMSAQRVLREIEQKVRAQQKQKQTKGRQNQVQKANKSQKRIKSPEIRKQIFLPTKESVLMSLNNQSTKSFSKEEKQILFEMWQNEQKLYREERRMMWLCGSQAKQYISANFNKDYYQQLLKMNLNYPNPCFNQIELDLKRTSMDLSEEQTIEFINQLRNVLSCYIKRNPTIGYCQGMNFIVAKLLSIMNEEEAFWTLCLIMESILPIDQYVNMVGILIDQKVFRDMMSDLMPQLTEHLDEINFDPSLLIFQWFVCLFTNNIKPEIQVKIIDLLFILGNKALFLSALAIIYSLKNELENALDFQSAFTIVDNYSKELITTKEFTEAVTKIQEFVKTDDIEKLREKNRSVVEQELQENIDQKEQVIQGTYMKFQFVNKFYLNQGLSKHYNQNINECKTIEQFDQKFFTYFNCDSSKWPICLFDFTYKNRIPNYLCFKTTTDLQSLIQEDHFYGESNIKKSPNILDKVLSDDVLKETFQQKQLLIERNTHICTKDKLLQQKFKYLICEHASYLCQEDCFNYKINDEIGLNQKKEDFVKVISSWDLPIIQIYDKSKESFKVPYSQDDFGLDHAQKYKIPRRKHIKNQMSHAVNMPLDTLAEQDEEEIFKVLELQNLQNGLDELILKTLEIPSVSKRSTSVSLNSAVNSKQNHCQVVRNLSQINNIKVHGNQIEFEQTLGKRKTI